MSFIEIEGIEDVQERELLPVGEHTFVIDDVKGEQMDDSDAYKIRCRCSAVGYDSSDFAPVYHTVTTPGSDDDKDKRYWKIIMLKRFLAILDMNPNAGFNEEDLMGAEFTGYLDASEYEGREGRNLRLPPLAGE